MNIITIWTPKKPGGAAERKGILVIAWKMVKQALVARIRKFSNPLAPAGSFV